MSSRGDPCLQTEAYAGRPVFQPAHKTFKEPGMTLLYFIFISSIELRECMERDLSNQESRKKRPPNRQPFFYSN